MPTSSLDGPSSGDPRRGKAGFWRYAPLVVLLLVIGAVFGFGLHRHFSFTALADNREWLVAWVDRNGPLAALAFIAVYVAAVTASIPGAIFLTIVGGFLFGPWLGPVISMTASTIGAVLIFLIARTAFGAAFQRNAGPLIRQFESGFRENAFNYVLVLRFLPIVPFWLVNLAAALLGVRLTTFVLATVIGLVPGAAIYANLGNGLGMMLDEGRVPDFGIIFTPSILLPLIGLAVLALLPVVYKKLKRS